MSAAAVLRMQNGGRRMFEKDRSLKARLALLIAFVVFIIVTPLVGTVNGSLNGKIVDAATAGAYSELVRLLPIVFAMFLVHGLCRFFIQSIRARLVCQERRSLKQSMFSGLFRFSHQDFGEEETGVHIATFSNDISILEYRYIEAILSGVEDLISIITYGSAIIYLNRKLAIVIMGGELFSVLVCVFARKYSNDCNNRYIAALNEFTQRLKDYFHSFQTIRNYSVENQFISKFSRVNDRTEEMKTTADQALAFANTLSNVCNSCTKFAIFGYGVILMIHGEITIGVMFVAYNYTDSFIGPIHDFLKQINAVESVRGVRDRVKKLIRAPMDTAQGALPEATEHSGESAVEFRNVSLTLGDTPILQSVSYEFRKGRKYLIVGKNGSGKSSMLQLLKKKWDSFDGELFIDGAEIRSLDTVQLSSQISYINEHVSLMCDTVENNITLYRSIEPERIAEACEKAGLRVPLDRVIRDGERNLSSGEQRRLEIARAMISQTQTIIFDEAVSTLDVLTAYEIEKLLLSLPETVLFVSHNFSAQLLGQYDEILVMDGGRILDTGTHEALMQSCALYQEMISIKTGKRT